MVHWTGACRTSSFLTSFLIINSEFAMESTKEDRKETQRLGLVGLTRTGLSRNPLNDIFLKNHSFSPLGSARFIKSPLAQEADL